MSNKTVGRFLLSFLTLCLIVSIFGLSYKEEKVVVKRYIKTINKVKSEKDLKKLEKYSENPEEILLLASQIEENIPNINQYTKKEKDKIHKLTIKTITQIPKYKIIKDEKENDDLKIITMKLEIIDITKIKKELQKGKKDNKISKNFKENYKQLEEIYLNNKQYKEKTITAYIKKENSKWKLKTDSKFYKDIYS